MFQGGTSAAVRDDHDRSQSSGVRRATSEDMPLVDVLAGPSGRSDARRGHHLTRNTLSRSARRCRLKVIQGVVLNTWSESAAVMVCSNVCRGRR